MRSVNGEENQLRRDQQPQRNQKRPGNSPTDKIGIMERSAGSGSGCLGHGVLLFYVRERSLRSFQFGQRLKLRRRSLRLIVHLRV